MTSLAVLTFSGWNWLVPAVVFLGIGTAILFWSYRAAPAGSLRWACFALKAAALAALALCLLEPMWFGERARPGANFFAVLVDNSKSLQIKDSGSVQSRGEGIVKLLDPTRARWMTRLAESFSVRRYVFDSRLQATEDFHELNFDGRSTALAGSVHSLADRFQGRPLAGMILLTDGNATDIRGAAPDYSRLPPIYPVVIGSQDPVRDIALQRVSVSQTAFEDSPVSIQADASAAGYRGQSIFAHLTDEAGKPVQQQTLTAGGDAESLAFRFQLKPERSGVLFYRLDVGLEQGAKPVDSGEATLANNSRVFVVDRGRGPHRILYVAGHPTEEYKFLNRAVQEDKEIDLVGLVRVARSEPKFDYRGRVGETTNPLYRGFNNQAKEDTERYDQPVHIRLNTRDAVELRSGFPTVPEELYGYDAVIVDDVEAAYFSPVQALLLQKFVSERGGGFLMLGGMQSFREGAYERTPIGDMLPVYLDGPSGSPPPPPGGYRFQLTREGLLQPWARVRDNEGEERARREAMPGFEVVNRVRGVKPGASLIASLKDSQGGEAPGLAVQRFGRGRTATLMLGDLWKWGFLDDANHGDSDRDKSWRQLVRWLVADVPARVELAVEPQTGDPNDAVRLQVRVRDSKFQPMDEAAVNIEVTPVLSDGATGAMAKPIHILADPALSEAGLYEATFVPRLTGGYRATAIVTNSVGAEAGRAEAGWSTDLAAEEFRSLTPNIGFLEALAKGTGGRMVKAEELDSFVSKLPSLKAPVMEAWSYPLWHTPEMFGFALACLLAEWFLRRRKGLA